MLSSCAGVARPGPGHGRQMDHRVLPMARLGQPVGIHDVALHESGSVDARRAAAEAGHGMAGLEQFSEDIAADGAAAAGYEDVHELDLLSYTYFKKRQDFLSHVWSNCSDTVGRRIDSCYTPNTSSTFKLNPSSVGDLSVSPSPKVSTTS